METLAYKPTLHEILPRLRSLYERRATDRIFAAFDVPSAAIAEFARQYAHGFCDYPDPAERVRFWDRLFSERAAIEDDDVPAAYLSEMDQGLYGGLLGGKVQFMAHPENGWISSMVAPLLADWSEFDSLRFDPDHVWFRRYLAQLDAFVRGSRSKFGISHFILIDGLNFAFELVGATETYLSLAERPEMVRRVIELAFELNAKVQDTFFEHVPLLEGGTCSNMCEWVPGRIVSESVDPFHMTSVKYLETWGREPIERMLGRFDGGVLHLHGNGRHLLEVVCSLKGAKAIRMGDDKGFPLAFDVLDSLRARAGDMPLVVEVEYAKFADALLKHRLPGGVLYKVAKTPDIATANRFMETVREYRC
ncbi:MAG: hypothetical protein HUU20_24745 [Pirellulales bacterium]|nr:hypothetical protein [Pirellulales bacterium]